MKYQEGYKYQLKEDYSIQTPFKPLLPFQTEYIDMTPDGLMTIRDGYAWDGASGPTIDTKSSMRGSLVHDALYQLIREGFLPENCRLIADDMLYEICVEDGMYKWRAFLWKWAVNTFAKKAADYKNERPILTAP